MTERKRLIELLNSKISHLVLTDTDFVWTCERINDLADYLLANGVIVPPVAVGDVVYYIKGGYYRDPKYCEVSRPCMVVEVSLKLQRGGERVMRGFITDNGTRYNFDSIGKTVFLSREEAEAALERSRG